MASASSVVPFPTASASVSSAVPFPTASVSLVVPSILSTPPFLTDEDLANPTSPFHRDTSPICIASGSMHVQGSYAGFSSYALRFEVTPHATIDLHSQMRLDIEDDPQVQTGHPHRFIIICRLGTKLVGLDVCPSHSKSVNIFPLLLTLRSRTGAITGYIAHPFLCGSVSFNPTTKTSHQDWYLASPGWGQGGGIVSSYAAALSLIGRYKRLTGRSPGVIMGLSSSLPTLGARSDSSRASSQCRGAPTVSVPRICSYILSQLELLGTTNFSDWDLLSRETAAFPGR